MTYDLIIIGNGIAAQTFLWNLGKKHLSDANKRQNFSIAQVYNEKLAPSCTLRSTATVSLNGIEENVSELGNDLRDSFHLFENLFKTEHPDGIIPVKQTLIYSNANDRAKMIRRFKDLDTITSSHFKSVHEGKILDSFLLQPEILALWFIKDSGLSPKLFPLFLKNFSVNSENKIYELTLENQQVLNAKRVVFANGAYAKIYAHFFTSDILPFDESKNTIKAGSFLERSIDLGSVSFLLTIDQSQVSYKAPEKKIVIGTSMTVGNIEAPDVAVLNEVFLKCQSFVNFDLGEFQDYQFVTGLRHKGPRRKYIAGKIHPDHEVFQINGFYKNGYTLSLLAAENICRDLNL